MNLLHDPAFWRIVVIPGAILVVWFIFWICWAWQPWREE
jgi:hypothetical protein